MEVPLEYLMSCHENILRKGNQNIFGVKVLVDPVVEKEGNIKHSNKVCKRYVSLTV